MCRRPRRPHAPKRTWNVPPIQRVAVRGIFQEDSRQKLRVVLGAMPLRPFLTTGQAASTLGWRGFLAEAGPMLGALGYHLPRRQVAGNREAGLAASRRRKGNDVRAREAWSVRIGFDATVVREIALLGSSAIPREALTAFSSAGGRRSVGKPDEGIA